MQIGQVDKKVLGQTGLTVSQLGYGSMGLRGPRTWGVRTVSEDRAEELLNVVLDAGINLIDTSPDYGASEERIGRSIGSRRDEFYVATKCGCAPKQHADHLEIAHVWSTDVVKRNLEKSLERLRTDHIDILQFHGGDAETLQRAGLIDLVLDFKAQGIVGFVGVSSKLPEANAHLDLGVFDTFQVPYSCLAPEHGEFITRAAEAGAGVIIRGGIAQGGPDAEIQRPLLNDVWTQAKLDELLPEGMCRAELILRYTLGHPNCHTSIIGTCSQQHLEENIAAADADALPPDLQQQIRQRVLSLSC